ncbi:hypothetical protein [Streptomyces sp. A5-4]|uniref:hypothetical protein n=1 Tax=Streptomyces sp. A5-4 TaxID=3384771 RepID=UPI003DA7ABD9
MARIPANVPPNSVGPYKRELERRFRAAVAEARQSKALDLYLPVKPMDGVSVGASILVSESVVPRRPGRPQGAVEPTGVAVQLLSRDGVEGADLSSGEIDGALAVRREHVADAASTTPLKLRFRSWWRSAPPRVSTRRPSAPSPRRRTRTQSSPPVVKSVQSQTLGTGMSTFRYIPQEDSPHTLACVRYAWRDEERGADVVVWTAS